MKNFFFLFLPIIVHPGKLLARTTKDGAVNRVVGAVKLTQLRPHHQGES